MEDTPVDGSRAPTITQDVAAVWRAAAERVAHEAGEPVDIDETDEIDEIDEGDLEADLDLGPPTWHTGAAGLFLLALPALILGIGEILWEAGLREGHVLAAAAEALLGRGFEDDPAAEMFGGATPKPTAVSDWALHEVRRRLSDAVREAFGVDDPSPEDVVIVGPPGWPELIAMVAGALSAGFRTPLGADPPVRDWLIGEGRLIDTGDRLIVVRPMTAVDLDVRRAGLDRDPGYVPWLRKSVAFVFESEEW